MVEYDGVGYAVRTFYDRLGRKVAQVDRDDFLTVWTRDTNGNAVSETRYAYRVASAPPLTATVNDLIALVGGGAPSLDRATSFTYDKNGRRLTETRAGRRRLDGRAASCSPRRRPTPPSPTPITRSATSPARPRRTATSRCSNMTIRAG